MVEVAEQRVVTAQRHVGVLANREGILPADVDRVLGRTNEDGVRIVYSRRSDVLAVLRVGVGIAEVEGQALGRLERDVQFGAIDLAARGVGDQAGRVATAEIDHGRDLKIAVVVVVDRRIDPRRAIQPHRLDPRFESIKLFRTEYQCGLCRGKRRVLVAARLEPAAPAGVEVQIACRLPRQHDARVERAELHARVDLHERCSDERLGVGGGTPQGCLLEVLGPAAAQRQIDRVGDVDCCLAERRDAFGPVVAVGGIDLRGHAIQRCLRRDAVHAELERVLVEASVLVIVDAQNPVDPAAERQRALRLRHKAQFLRELLRGLVADLADHVEVSVVEVAIVRVLQLAVRSDRNERTYAQIERRLAGESIDVAVIGRIAGVILRKRIGRADRRGDVRTVQQDAVRVGDSALADTLERRALVTHQFADQVDLEVLGGVQLQPGAAAVVVEPLGLVPGGQVGDVPFAVRTPAGETRLDRVTRNRAGNGGEQLVAVIVADAGFALDVKIAGRCLGDHVDRAADGVAAIERALRTLQHFDAFDILEHAQHAAGAAQVAFIDEHADRRFRTRIELARTDAADVKLRTAGAETAGVEAGDARRDVADVEHAGGPQRLAVERGDRGRNILKAFRTALRGNDDVGRAVFFSGCVGSCLRLLLSCGERRISERGSRQKRRNDNLLYVHLDFPPIEDAQLLIASELLALANWPEARIT